MNAADIIAARLFEAGVRTAFGIPGGEVLTLIDALERVGIRFVLTKHENPAGFMAEGAWHATGAPGVLIATVGPGVANAFNVVANAEQDRVPLIVISGMVDPAEALSYTHQVFDHGAVFGQVCKASIRVPQGGADVAIAKALRIAMTPRKGPVHLDLPIAVAAADQPEAKPVPLVPADLPPAMPSPEALALFETAERPVIVAGLDVLEEPDGPAALRDFAERHRIPVLTTYKAKGVLPENHPLSLGGHGLSPKSDTAVLPLLAGSDCVIAVGYDPIEMRAGWKSPWDPAACIELAHAPNTHDMHHAAHSALGDTTAGLELLETSTDPRPRWSEAALAEARAAIWDPFRPAGDWGPDHAVAEMNAAAPDDTVITMDSGAHRILISQMWQAKGPRQALQSSALCTMGCALPIAAGYKLMRPETPVVAFMGDAGIEMILGELSTLRDQRIALVVVVFVDQSLALIELKQRRMGFQNAGVDFDRTDFAALARIYGGTGVTVREPGAAGPALTEALARDHFTLIEVEIPRRAYDCLI